MIHLPPNWGDLPPEEKLLADEKAISGCRPVATFTAWIVLVIILALLSSLSGHAQHIKQHDSTWLEVKEDTLFGVIQYPVGQGVVKGPGIIVETETTEWHKLVPEIKPVIDTTHGWTHVFFANSSWGDTAPATKIPYIKTSAGYKYIQGEFTFTPK
jgi:hypothetical protein